MRIRRACALAFGIAFASSVPAAAQTQSATNATQQATRRWDIEGYGGVSLGGLSRGGSLSLPEPGPPITTSNPTFPSWSVPSWFFGDGAEFLNHVAAEFRLAGRIAPFDPFLQPSGLNSAGHFLAGVRVRRELTTAYSLEAALEVSAQPAAVQDSLRAGLDATSASFQSAFAELLASGPFTSPTVSSTADAVPGSSRELVMTAAIVAPFGSSGSFSPYAVAGGGVLVSLGEPPTATLAGRYRFQIAGVNPVDETDTLTVRYEGRTVFVGVFGAGVRRSFSDRAGLQIDGRILVGPRATSVRVDATPAVVTATPAGFIESFTYPNLQFSNNPSTGRRSTLGAPALEDVDVFSGGWMLRGRLTAGIYLRF